MATTGGVVGNPVDEAQGRRRGSAVKTLDGGQRPRRREGVWQLFPLWKKSYPLPKISVNSRI